VDRLSRGGAFAIALASLVVLGIIDYATGVEVSFSIFYLIPVSLTAWYCGLMPGIGIAFLSAVIWEVVNRLAGLRYSALWIDVWNPGTRFAFYVCVCYLLVEKRRTERLLEQLSATDPLTGLANRRAFLAQLDVELARQARNTRPLSVVFIDLDHFKALNDGQGHDAGDAALRTVAGILRGSLRKTDLAARLGGDEFALILPETEGSQGEPLVGRLREALLAAMRENGWPITFSMGIAHGVAPIGSDRWLKAADEAMYGVKRDGRDAIRLRPVSASPMA
jgi:diguanylate cyclase (GGDEF)-like protein